MMIVKCNSSYKEERQYIVRLLLEKYLNISFVVVWEERRDWCINYGDSSLLFPDILFRTPREKWLTPESLPDQPLPVLDVRSINVDCSLVEYKIPVIYGDRRFISNSSSGKINGNGLYAPIDIFGSAFFMLTRYEELVKKERDNHGRFSAKASLGFQEGFLDRPIVDEYVEILWSCMKRLWPGLERRKRSYQVFLGHDVDQPFAAVGRPWPKLIRNMAGDILKRKSLVLAGKRFLSKILRKPTLDPFNTFEFIMDLSEKFGLQSTFCFKSGVTNRVFDECYSLQDRNIKAILKNIHERGHEIGLHPSYETYRDINKLKSEYRKLIDVLHELKIEQRSLGARQHYLRWEAPTTWNIYERVGLDYDATLGFADHVGFRCGTCHSFPVFDLKDRKSLKLNECPLIVMEGTLLGEEYMGLSEEQALEYIERLSYVCRFYSGTFSLLWHNSMLIGNYKDLYLKVVEMIV